MLCPCFWHPAAHFYTTPRTAPSLLGNVNKKRKIFKSDLALWTECRGPIAHPFSVRKTASRKQQPRLSTENRRIFMHGMLAHRPLHHRDMHACMVSMEHWCAADQRRLQYADATPHRLLLLDNGYPAVGPEVQRDISLYLFLLQASCQGFISAVI